MFKTTKNETGLTITKYTGNGKNVVIPKQIDGIMVTKIGYRAFNYNKLQNVVIPDSVTHIGADAFYNNELQNVVIPDSVTHIGDYAFYNNKLRNVVIPDSVTHIGDCAFRSNEPLKQINGQPARCIDGYAMLIDSTKKSSNGIIHKCRYFETKKQCYVAEQTVENTVYTAHGKTIRQAVVDLRFKILQSTANLDDIVSEIKRKQTVSVHEYRLITGACQHGCELFLQQNGIAVDELPT